jgi:hypothetical protein
MYFWTGTSSGWTDNPNDYEVDFGPDAGTPLVTTYPELLQQGGVSWKVYTNNQAGDAGGADAFLGDFGDNPLWFYQQYNSTNSRDGGTSTLAVNGAVTPWQTDAGAPAMSETHASYVLSKFLDDVDSNALPQVSWIVAPAGYSEHPSYTPDYGAHYVNTVVQALFAKPELWEETALFVTYDEHDGFFDHQLPPFPEASVADEHIDGEPIGLGTRVPMLIVSPWTRGGYVDSNVYSHTSMLAFLQTWTGVKPANVTDWRSSVTGDLTAAFDFQHPDFSIPGNIPSLDETWANVNKSGGSTATPPEGDQKMPVQEPGRRPHRPSSHQPAADVTVPLDRHRHGEPDEHGPGGRRVPGVPGCLPGAVGHSRHGPVRQARQLHVGHDGHGRQLRVLRVRPRRVPHELQGRGRPRGQQQGRGPGRHRHPAAGEFPAAADQPVQPGRPGGRLHADAQRLRGQEADRHRARGRHAAGCVAGRPRRLPRRRHHREHERRLHPPLRGPGRLSGETVGRSVNSRS